jgi:hypothetical protein
MAILLQPARRVATTRLSDHGSVRGGRCRIDLGNHTLHPSPHVVDARRSAPAGGPSRPLLDSGFNYSMEGAIPLVILFDY